MGQWRSVAKISGYTGYLFTNKNMRAKRAQKAVTQNLGDTLVPRGYGMPLLTVGTAT